HFGGIPFFVLDQQFDRRERPLVLAGPHGFRKRLNETMEALFPGSTSVQRRFRLDVLELTPGVQTQVGPALVSAVQVVHPSGARAFGLRLTAGERLISYSGDTEWTDAVLELAASADLFICEAYTYQREIKYHMSYAALRAHHAQLICKRTILTHPGPD